MDLTRYDFKVAFLDRLLSEHPPETTLQVLDMGSGTSKDFAEILDRFPNVRYTGIEFDGAALDTARDLVGDKPNVTLVQGFGEAGALHDDQFDVTLSLSVLEHVKNLRGFLEESVRVTKPGGRLVHRYDLGHALHPSSIRERLEVLAAKRFPFAVPATRFTTHPSQVEIVDRLTSLGVTIEKVEYGQLPSLKAMMNRVEWEGPEAPEISRGILELDRQLSQYMGARLSLAEMEYHFPTVTFFGLKPGAAPPTAQ